MKRGMQASSQVEGADDNAWPDVARTSSTATGYGAS